MSAGNLKSWKKGESGNPHGRPALPPEVRAERKKNQAALILLVSKFFSLTEARAKKELKRKGATQLEKTIQGMINKAKEGDTSAFKYLIEVVCGHIPEYDTESPADTMSPEEKLALLERATEAIRAQMKSHGSG